VATVHQIVGNAVAEWDDTVPLAWTMTETKGTKDDQRRETKEFDLSSLAEGYEDTFLLALKNLLMARRKRVALNSVKTEESGMRSLLSKVRSRQMGDTKIVRIDLTFLLTLRTMLEDVSVGNLQTLKRLFTGNRESPLFATDLALSDFPLKKPAKGWEGTKIDHVLAKALSRTACVEILRRSEDAYERGDIDIGHFAFLHLAFHIYCRPSSYRSLTLNDLKTDVDPTTKIRTHFLLVTPKKSRISNRSLKKTPYRLDRTVGELLEAQRIQVIKTWQHLVGDENIGKLALFPARSVGPDGQWSSEHARMYFGEPDDSTFRKDYLAPILKLQESITFDFSALRHTIGTQLAVAGCSAATIAAVLKHATNATCQKYVDLAFQGLIDSLSDAMQPAFNAHFPVFETFRSKVDPVTPGKAIHSIELATGRRELTGECGKINACQYAPIACYPCPRFAPCFDADHSVNLHLVEAEIKKYESGGLPFRALVSQFKDARRYILLVIAAASQYRDTLAQRKTNQ
jgi:integrase